MGLIVKIFVILASFILGLCFYTGAVTFCTTTLMSNKTMEIGAGDILTASPNEMEDLKKCFFKISFPTKVQWMCVCLVAMILVRNQVFYWVLAGFYLIELLTTFLATTLVVTEEYLKRETDVTFQMGTWAYLGMLLILRLLILLFLLHPIDTKKKETKDEMLTNLIPSIP